MQDITTINLNKIQALLDLDLEMVGSNHFFQIVNKTSRENKSLHKRETSQCKCSINTVGFTMPVMHNSATLNMINTTDFVSFFLFLEE